jgi:hypothetical protein
MGEYRQLCAKSPHRSKWEKNCRFVREYKLCAKSPPYVKGRKTAVFVRESFMLERRGSSNMVSMVNSFCSLKEFCLVSLFSSMSNITFVLNHPIQVKGRSTVALVRKD